MRYTSLAEYREQFKTCVLKHINESLPKEEWIWLREQAENQLMGFMPIEPFDYAASPESLVETSVCEDGLKVDDVIKPYNHQVIDSIADQPLYYCTKAGIYIWSPDPGALWCLSFWITYPKYPPGW